MPERSPEVERVVRDWLAAKQAADAEAIRASLSGYEHDLAVGTEAAEWWVGASAFAEAHVAGGPFAVEVEHVEAHAHGAVAWAAVGGGMAVRLTVVLVREDDGHWRVAQSHASVPSDA